VSRSSQSLSRRPVWAAPALAGTVWAGLVAAWLALEAAGIAEGPLCPFHRWTGLPCPSCGITRGLARLAAGDPLGCWLHNPLAFTVLATGFGLLAVRTWRGRWHLPNLSRRGRTAAWILAAGAFLANWAYLIAFVG
jgi:hypothetical protein